MTNNRDALWGRMVKPLSPHGKRALRSGASACYIKAKASQLFDKNVIRFRNGGMYDRDIY
ncbi:MAG TPA: hypothetical protein VI479_17230 [Blastocatellia bacterium]